MTVPRKPALTPRVRFAISFLIVAHLIAVVTPPLAFQTRGPLGPSPSVATLARPLEGYGQFLYIDRGYAFFAPDPGPSHLFEVAVRHNDGSTSEQMFPDLDAQWPRLLYHRHFMLAEYLQEIYQPPGPPAGLREADPVQAELWQRARARYEHVRRSVVGHLEHAHPGAKVSLRRLEHLLPDVVAYQREPIELSDRQLYRVLPDRWEIEPELSPASPPRATEAIPPPRGATDPIDRDKTPVNVEAGL